MLLEYFSYHQYILIVFTIPMVTAVHAMRENRAELYASASVLIHVGGATAILCNIAFWTDPNRKRDFDNFIVHGANMVIITIEILLNRLHPRTSYASFGILSLLLYVLIILFPMYATRSRWIYSQIDPKYSSWVAIVVFYLCVPLGFLLSHLIVVFGMRQRLKLIERNPTSATTDPEEELGEVSEYEAAPDSTGRSPMEPNSIPTAHAIFGLACALFYCICNLFLH
ncbi:hypothetical protein NDN08_007127 [Rhodosorus marinus]|uniref:Transmembrane protein 107 n=1 Tax=Rhodosorus marinus TaxID=101924 RepID=A0AAV8UFM2_9RHOD|nr:hypothetical protein NDN08_007127 [Rhodosorus marinus]